MFLQRNRRTNWTMVFSFYECFGTEFATKTVFGRDNALILNAKINREPTTREKFQQKFKDRDGGAQETAVGRVYIQKGPATRRHRFPYGGKRKSSSARLRNTHTVVHHPRSAPPSVARRRARRANFTYGRREFRPSRVSSVLASGSVSRVSSAYPRACRQSPASREQISSSLVSRRCTRPCVSSSSFCSARQKRFRNTKREENGRARAAGGSPCTSVSCGSPTTRLTKERHTCEYIIYIFVFEQRVTMAAVGNGFRTFSPSTTACRRDARPLFFPPIFEPRPTAGRDVRTISPAIPVHVSRIRLFVDDVFTLCETVPSTVGWKIIVTH